MHLDVGGLGRFDSGLRLRRDQGMVFRKKSRLAPSSIVLVDDTLVGDTIKHADGSQRCGLGSARITRRDRYFSFLHKRARFGAEWLVALPPPLGDANALF